MARSNRSIVGSRRWWGALGLGLAMLAAACEAAPEPGSHVGPALVQSTKMGPVLADPAGMTLYTYKDDDTGVSACYGRCAKSWPPFLAAASDKPNGKFNVTARKDGARQWVYDGRPLYLWDKDKKPGDVTGHGYGQVWYVARP
jgi:predicted lipoprotein with Yx(FWY)xxD motif